MTWFMPNEKRLCCGAAMRNSHVYKTKLFPVSLISALKIVRIESISIFKAISDSAICKLFNQKCIPSEVLLICSIIAL
jgi:hypothetical protein